MAPFCSDRPLAPALLEMADALRSAQHIDAALRAVTHTAQTLSKSAQATLRLVDPQGSGLLLAARSGDAMHRGGAGRFSADESRSLLGWCVKHARSAMVNDVPADDRFQARAGQTWMPSGVLVAPLLGREDVFGVLSVARKDGPDYGAEDLMHLELIAAMAAPHVQVELLGELAETDPLTLLRNRLHLSKRLPIEIDAAMRHGWPVSVVALDLDHFKRVNDTYRHRVGDQVLVEVAARMRRASRSSDVLVRTGGEEFLAVLPRACAADAAAWARRLLAALRGEAVVTEAKPLRITASAGVCEVRLYDDLDAVIDRADKLLYAAKDAGRDRVVTEPAHDALDESRPTEQEP